MKVYLAARYSRREELLGYRSWLLAAGVSCTALWLDGHDLPEGLEDGDSREIAFTSQRAEWAAEDLKGINAADLVVCFTEPEATTARRGGRHVEMGYALGRGKTVWIVGPRENVFTCLPQVRVYDDWFTASADIARWHADDRSPKAVAS